MKKLKILIYVFLVIIILLISGIILIISKNNNEKNENMVNESIENIKNDSIDPGVSKEDINLAYEKNDNILKYVQSREEYFNIKGIYNKYLSQIADNNGEDLLKMFSEDYCKGHDLNSSNIVISTGVKTISDPRNMGTYTPIILDMLVADISEDMKVYLIYGRYLLKSTAEVNNLNFMIILDNQNMLYDVYPYSYMKEKGYDKLSVNNKIEIKDYSVSNRESNKFTNNSISDKDIANYLFDDWCNSYLYDTKNSYNKLNVEYRNTKFKDYKNFANYLSSQKYIPSINEYRVYSTNSYTDYICTDQYNNYYIFRQQGGIMRYTVFLDSYTVELDTFKENYEKAEEGTKVAIQIGKFKQMLNSKDYNAIYNKLNSTFKKNNYSTVSKLENYLAKNKYDINTITIEDYSQHEDYYVCQCTLQNQKNTSEQKKMTIAIKLIDSNNFEMSFSIN